MTIKYSGFTLIELMVVLAIMGILTMVAYPGYQESIRKSRRADGVAGALALQVRQEKFRANCPVYADSIDTVGPDDVCNTTTDTYTLVAEDTSPEDYYAMSFSAASGNSYTITATAQGTQATDTTCTPLTITFDASNPNGEKGPDGCWP